jgi:hypothetical protein
MPRIILVVIILLLIALIIVFSIWDGSKEKAWRAVEHMSEEETHFLFDDEDSTNKKVSKPIGKLDEPITHDTKSVLSITDFSDYEERM